MIETLTVFYVIYCGLSFCVSPFSIGDVRKPVTPGMVLWNMLWMAGLIFILLK